MQHLKLESGHKRSGGEVGKAALLSCEEAMVMAAARVRCLNHQESVPISAALGRRLAGELTASHDLPPFDQSAMDGYALAGTGQSGTYAIADGPGTYAGDRPAYLGPGQAARIATGAPIPIGADRVVMRENAKQTGRTVSVLDEGVAVGSNIRLRGEDVVRGDALLPRGVRIDAQKMALLAAQGHREIEVLCRPKLAVVSSGNEVRQPGDALGQAGVFDSNRPMLIALAASAGAEVEDGGWCPDDADTLASVISRLAERNHLVVISGGSSAGDHDLTASAMQRAEAEVQQLRIAMKPGKPAIIGSLGRSAILGLPGNPVAAFVSWFILGRSMMAEIFGVGDDLFKGRQLQASNNFSRRPGRTEFVPARRIGTNQGDLVEFLGRGGSGSILPLARADGLIRIQSERGDVKRGELVTFLPFDDDAHR